MPPADPGESRPSRGIPPFSVVPLLGPPHALHSDLFRGFRRVHARHAQWSLWGDDDAGGGEEGSRTGASVGDLGLGVFGLRNALCPPWYPPPPLGCRVPTSSPAKDAPSLYLGPEEDRSSKPVATLPSASICHLPSDCISFFRSPSVMLLTTFPASSLLTCMSL